MGGRAVVAGAYYCYEKEKEKEKKASARQSTDGRLPIVLFLYCINTYGSTTVRLYRIVAVSSLGTMSLLVAIIPNSCTFSIIMVSI